MQRKSFFQIVKIILIYFISLYVLLIQNSCTGSTEVQKGSLSGVVILENQTDHSGITVAVYDLVELDPEIVSINHQYPHIGVIINQHTEFDHRFQSPVKYTETDAEGYFEIKKIPTGTYNIVALKDSFGFKYIYEFEIEKEDNALTPNPSPRGRGEELTPRPPLFNPIEGEIKNKDGEIPLRHVVAEYHEDGKGELIYPVESSYSTGKGVNLDGREADITLYPETTFSNGLITGNPIFESDHHYIIEVDTDLYTTASLTIQPGAVIRIEPGKDFAILGSLTAQGEENNMYWVTSNDGFDGILTKHDSLQYYNKMELTNLASVADDLIEWGKWDWGTHSFSSSVSNADFSSCIFRNSESGLSISSGINMNTENILAYNCYNSSYGGIVCFNVDILNIEKSIYLQNYNGLYAKFCDSTLIKNNYISNNYRGIWGLTVFGDIEHNELTSNSECDIKLAGNTPQGEIRIKYNNLRSNTGIWQYEQGSFSGFYILIINFNNFYSSEWFIKYDSSGHYHGVDIDATYNYFFECNSLEHILEKVLDTNEVPPQLVTVIVNNFLTSPTNGGIE